MLRHLANSYRRRILTATLNRSEWSALRPDHFTPGEKYPDTHTIRGCVGPRACLDVLEKRILEIAGG